MRARKALLIASTPLMVLAAVLLLHVSRVACMTVPVVDVVPRGIPAPAGSAGAALEREAGHEGSAGIVLGGGGEEVVAGAFHVDTTYSDGRGDLDEVAAAAAKAGLDYILLADHNVDPPPPHRRHGVLVVPGVELSTSAGHIVAAGARRSAPWRMREDDPIGAARHAGGVAVLAHPVNLKLPWSGSWEDADGMEIVSGDSLFRESLADPWRRLLPAVASAPASTTIGWLYMHHRPDEAFERWDGLPGHVGLCAHDAHGYEGYVGPFRAMQLRLRLSEAPPEDAEEAAALVIEALRKGRAWCTLGGLADPAGFVLESKGEPPLVRASLEYESWPGGVRPLVILFRGGERVAEGELCAEVEAARPGLYRAEVQLDLPWVWGRREMLWIFTGTVKVGD